MSDILPRTGKRFRFEYQYDFGDGWRHEVLFEGCLRAERSQRYPLCLEGARACPPEDVGGTWGYADFVEAIQNEDHEQHEDMLRWAGGMFDPEAFDPTKGHEADVAGAAGLATDDGKCLLASAAGAIPPPQTDILAFLVQIRT